MKNSCLQPLFSVVWLPVYWTVLLVWHLGIQYFPLLLVSFFVHLRGEEGGLEKGRKLGVKLKKEYYC